MPPESRCAGVRAGVYVLLRLPLEVGPLFRDWLARLRPEAARRVMSHVQDMRGGRDNDPRFRHRMRGGGDYADLIRRRFVIAARRLGFDEGPALRTDLFRPPATGGQLSLL